LDPPKWWFGCHPRGSNEISNHPGSNSSRAASASPVVPEGASSQRRPWWEEAPRRQETIYPWQKQDTFGQGSGPTPAMLPVEGDQARDVKRRKGTDAQELSRQRSRKWVTERLGNVDKLLAEQAAKRGPPPPKEEFCRNRMMETGRQYATQPAASSHRSQSAMEMGQSLQDLDRSIPVQGLHGGCTSMGYPGMGVWLRHKDRSDDLNSTPSNTNRSSKSIVNTSRERRRMEKWAAKNIPTTPSAFAHSSTSIPGKNDPHLPSGCGGHKMVSNMAKIPVHC